MSRSARVSRSRIPRGLPDERSVFLNIPYDSDYEPIFVAIVATLLAVGRTPLCTLELEDRGKGRPERIMALLERSRVSFHDLSHVELPPRFNMPFELGVAWAMREYRGRHDLHVFERVPYRLLKTLTRHQAQGRADSPRLPAASGLVCLRCSREIW